MTKQGRIIGAVRRRASGTSRRLISHWKQYDRRYGWRWRTANGLAALLIVSSVALPVISEIRKNQAYKLSNATLDLIGPNRGTLANKLKYNAQTKVYEFNKEVVAEDNPLSQLKAQVGGSSDKSKQLYALDVHEDMSKGVTFYDTNSQLNFSMVPQFKAMPGKIEQGHLVFPLGGGPQAIYTLKNNGLKEDIVVQKATDDTMRFSYKLELPSTLEARALPDKSGGIGIYAANPNLYSDMSYGSDKDRELVEKARTNAEKDSLVFGLPAPVITKATEDVDKQVTSRFELKDNTLAVIAEGLSNLTQPFSIDPSVVITSADNFNSGNNEGNIDFGISDDLKRGGLTGATVGSWSSQTPSTACSSRTASGTSVYNGYAYFVVNATGPTMQTCYAKLNSNGTISGAWLTGPTGLNASPTVFVYNGYLYALGGNTSAVSADTYYAKIGANGAPGAWIQGTTMNQARGNALSTGGPAAAVYNGYAYVSGGCTNAAVCGAQNTVEYAAINPDGTLGTWQPATNMPEAKSGNMMKAYNGYVYVMGGVTAGGTGTQNVYYAPINSNGSLGSWVLTSSLPVATYRFANSIVHNGYIYMVGGNGTSGDTAAIQYAPIYANGSLGAWATQTGLSSAEPYVAAWVYNNYMFVRFEGNTVYSAPIDSAGVIRPYATDSNDTIVATEGRDSAATVAYNGYIYVIGGRGYAGTLNDKNTILYASLNADGSTTGTAGVWNTTSDGSFVARYGLTAVAYGGYMYVIGGDHSTNDTACSDVANRYCNDVRKAPINAADGTIGTFTLAGTGTSSNYYSVTASGGVGGRNYLGAYVYQDRLYVFGGNYNTNSDVSTEVSWAPIGASGVLGAWTRLTTPMTDPSRPNGDPSEGGHSNFGYAGWGNKIYAVGGRTSVATNGAPNSTFNDTTLIGTIDPSTGDVTWDDSGLDFGTPVAFQSATISNGYLYVTGGATTGSGGGSGTSSTYYSRINSNGTLAGWQTLNSFTTARSHHGTVAYNGYLYVIGGCSGFILLFACSNAANTLEDIQYAQINNGGNGSTTTWASAGTGFTNARYLHATVAYNNFLYVAGGTCGGGSACNTDIQYAPINANGTIGNWGTDTDANANSQSIASMLAYKGYMYITTTGGGGNHSVQYALICTGSNNGVDGCGASAGSVGTWHLTTDFTAGQRIRHNFGVYNDRLYIFGGYNGSANMDDVLYASINSDGTIGSWTTQSGGLPAIHDSITLQIAINSNYVYAIDGTTGQVRSAPINSNGSIGSWTIVSTLPGTSNVSASYAYVANGYLYFLEGGNDGVFRNIVLYAAMGANGTLGPWAKATNTFSTPRNLLSGVFYNGNLYITGGCSGVLFFACTAYQNDVQYAGQQAIPRKGLYSKLIDFGYSSILRGFSYSGTLPNSTTAISYKGAASGPSWSSSGIASSLSNARCTGSSLMRYMLMSIPLDDSQQATYPDIDSNPTQLNDVTVLYEYVRPPNERLRLGQTLKNGTLSELDICKLQS